MNNEVMISDKQPAQLPAVSAETAMMMDLIQQIALNPEIPVEKMQAVINMKMQVFDKNAEIEYNKAMILAQKEMVPVIKMAKNTQTSSMYARMEDISRICKPIWTSHGFALQFGTDDCPIADHYRVTCEVSHASGFNKKYKADLPVDDEGIKGQKNKTGCHGFGSTMSYAQRYLTIMIFNITLEGADNDGNRQQPPQVIYAALPDRKNITNDGLNQAMAKIKSGDLTIQKLEALRQFTPLQRAAIDKWVAGAEWSDLTVENAQ